MGLAWGHRGVAHSGGGACRPLWPTSSQNSMACAGGLWAVGPLVILGMPFLRAHAVLFNRTARSMSFAPLSSRDHDVGLCEACPDEANANAAPDDASVSVHRGREKNALLPSAHDTKEDVTGDAASHAAQAGPGVMRLDDVRWPWWAVNPANRPAHVRGGVESQTANATVVQGRRSSPWRLVL